MECKKFKVIAGRVIVCDSGKFKGKEMFSIRKEDGFSPTEADAMARYIEKKLKKGDFDKFYKEYMK